MKYKFIQTLLLVLLPTLFAACGSDNNDPTDNIGGLTVRVQTLKTMKFPQREAVSFYR